MSFDEPSYNNLERKVALLDSSVNTGLSRLRSSLSDLESTVEDLEHLPGRVSTLEDDLRLARAKTDEVEEELDDRVTSLDGDLARIQRRVESLEIHLRRAEGAVVVDLDDDPGGKLLALANTVSKGIAAQAGLLAEYERRQLTYAGTQLRQAREQRRQHRAALVQAAAELATKPTGKRKAADKAFAAAVPKARDAHTRISALSTAAESAKIKLAADDNLRATKSRAINAGERADTTLRTRLRSRLTEAISGPDLLPLWFVTVLGPLPPRRSAEKWLDTATDLLVFRVTYRIADPLLALGPKVVTSTDARRQAWRQGLSEALRRW